MRGTEGHISGHMILCFLCALNAPETLACNLFKETEEEGLFTDPW
jgi:hypothetical protein